MIDRAALRAVAAAAICLGFMTMTASGQAASDRASTGDPAAVGQIKELLRKYEVSIDNIDLSLANQIWSHVPEVILIQPRGTERGLSAIEKNFYEQAMGNTFSQRQLLIESPAIHVYGDRHGASLHGRFTRPPATGQEDDNPGARISGLPQGEWNVARRMRPLLWFAGDRRTQGLLNSTSHGREVRISDKWKTSAPNP